MLFTNEMAHSKKPLLSLLIPPFIAVAFEGKITTHLLNELIKVAGKYYEREYV